MVYPEQEGVGSPKSGRAQIENNHNATFFFSLKRHQPELGHLEIKIRLSDLSLLIETSLHYMTSVCVPNGFLQEVSLNDRTIHWRLIEPWTDCLFCLLRYQEFWQYSATIGELIFSLIVQIGSILAKVYIIPWSILSFHWAFLCLQNFSVTTVTKVPFLTGDHKNGESVSVSPFLWSPFRKETFATFITHNF